MLARCQTLELRAALRPNQDDVTAILAELSYSTHTATELPDRVKLIWKIFANLGNIKIDMCQLCLQHLLVR